MVFGLNTPPSTKFWLILALNQGEGGYLSVGAKIDYYRVILKIDKNDVLKSALNQGGGVFKRGGGFKPNTTVIIFLRDTENLFWFSL